MAADVSRASKRRKCARIAGPAPSAVHYVGYVEDDETPESIARKFEELERIEAAARQASAAAPATRHQHVDDDSDHSGSCAVDGGLTDEQLKEVFKQTSIFTVTSAAANNESLLAGEALGVDEDVLDCYDSDELLAASDGQHCWPSDFWSSNNNSDEALGRRQCNRRTQDGLPRQPGHWQDGSTLALARRKVRISGREDADYGERPHGQPSSWRASGQLHVPPELVRSGRVVAVPDAGPCLAGRVIHCEDLLAANWRLKEMPKNSQAVLVNPGWVREDAAQSVTALGQLPMPRLCPVGMVFIWAPKQLLRAVVTQLYRWQFSYVESLTWVQLRPRNELLTQPSPYFRQSHLSLLMFRRTGLGKDIELRHQRNPDVIFDMMRKRQCGYDVAWDVPSSVYTIIETLLPTGKGRFLELWAAPAKQRPGWVHMSQQQPMNFVEPSLNTSCELTEESK